jgi:hypothetical protein
MFSENRRDGAVFCAEAPDGPLPERYLAAFSTKIRQRRPMR